MKRRYAVKVMPREVILDTQGRAVEQLLKLNKVQIDQVRIGRWVEIESHGSAEECAAAVKKAAQDLLHNPLIETFEIVELSK